MLIVELERQLCSCIGQSYDLEDAKPFLDKIASEDLCEGKLKDYVRQVCHTSNEHKHGDMGQEF